MRTIRDLTVLDVDKGMKTAAHATEANFDSMAMLVSLPPGESTVYEPLDPLVSYTLRSADLNGTVKAMYGGRDPQGVVVFLVASLPPAPAGA